MPRIKGNKVLGGMKTLLYLIALLTFSNKAATEMKERIEKEGVELKYIGTFHSISLKLINKYNLLEYDPTIIEGEHKLEFFKKSIKELQLKDMKLHMYGVNSDWDKLDEISKLLNYKVEVSSDHEKSMNFILTSQLLCV